MEPFFVYLQKKDRKSKYKSITHATVKEFLAREFYFINLDLLPAYSFEDDDDASDMQIPHFHEFYLFIWCVLTNRLEIAKIFWCLGNVCLLACAVTLARRFDVFQIF
jgi:hypothetical protein